MRTEYPRVSLAELLRLERRPVRVCPDQQYQEIGIYCFGRGIFHKTPRSGLEVGDKPLFLLREGDLIFQVTFAWEGAVALVTNAEDGMFGSTRYPTFRVDEPRCLPRYLLHYFKTQEGLQQLVKISPGSAGRNRVLSIRRLPEISLPLPPLSDQQRIVVRIDELAAKIQLARDLRRQATVETEALAASCLHSTFSQLRPQFIRQLRDVADIIGGGSLPDPALAEGGPSEVLFVKVSDMNRQGNDIFLSESASGVPANSPLLKHARVLPPNTIVFPKRGGAIATNKKRLLRRSAVLDPNLMGVIAKNERELAPEFLFKWFCNLDLASMQTGTSVPQINKEDLAPLPIPVLPLHEQRRITAYLDSLSEPMQALKAQQAEISEELDALMPSILDRAFRGEL